jgi:diphthamide synthase (EF-2-diphthine--ammonia ligase)
MLGEEGVTSSSHGLSREVLDAQAKSLGISTAYGKESKRDYEQQFKKMVLDHESRSIQGGVFGDINLQEHRDWIEKVCGETGIKPFLPLWHDNYDKLLNDFIGGGFEAIVVSAKTSLVEEY